MFKIFIFALGLVLPLQGFTASLEGQRILIQAIIANDVSTVKQTLHHRFDINEKSGQGHYVIHMATRKEVKDEILELILKAGARPDVKNREGQTPLHLAVLGDSPKKVLLLLKANADPSIGDSLGNTPLHLNADGKGSPSLTPLLLQSKKMNVNLKNGRGYTALMLASLRFSPVFSVVESLLKSGADPSIINLGRFTALDFAQGMLDYFKKHSEKYSGAIAEQEKILATISRWSDSSHSEKAN